MMMSNSIVALIENRKPPRRLGVKGAKYASDDGMLPLNSFQFPHQLRLPIQGQRMQRGVAAIDNGYGGVATAMAPSSSSLIRAHSGPVPHLPRASSELSTVPSM